MSKVSINWAEPDIGEEEIEAVTEAMKERWIGGNGPRVKKFELEFARLVGARYALAVANGTLALLCAMQCLRELGIAQKYIVPTFTFFATGATAKEMGEVYLVDADRKTFNMALDFSHLSSVPIVVPVDIAGLPIDYDELRKTKKIILADSAEALGSKYKGELVGKQADIHTFSFHSSKVVTTGEGGMITTNDEVKYNIMKSLINQGYAGANWWEYKHEKLGFNYRMSEIHAAIGLVQLKKLDRYVKERQEKANIYKDILGKLVTFQQIPKGYEMNYFLCIVLTQDPLSIVKGLKEQGIQTKLVWQPLHKQTPLKKKVSFPNAEYIADKGFLLPIGNRLGEEEVKEIANIVRRLIR